MVYYCDFGWFIIVLNYLKHVLTQLITTPFSRSSISGGTFFRETPAMRSTSVWARNLHLASFQESINEISRSTTELQRVTTVADQSQNGKHKKNWESNEKQNEKNENVLRVFSDEWYIYHNTDFGNLKWLLPRWIVCTILLIVFNLVLFYCGLNGIFGFSLMGSMMTDAICVSFVALSIGVVWYKTPLFSDYFEIRNEMKYLAITLISVGIMYFIFSVFLIIFNQFIFLYLILFITNIALTLVVLFSTKWVLLQIENKQKSVFSPRGDNISCCKTALRLIGCNNCCQMLKFQRWPSHVSTQVHVQKAMSRTAGNDNNELQIATKKAAKQKKTSVGIGLTGVIADEQGLDGFMSHLIKEFSIENGLFLIEATQYQQHYKQKFRLLSENTCTNNDNNYDGNITRVVTMSSSIGDITNISGIVRLKSETIGDHDNCIEKDYPRQVTKSLSLSSNSRKRKRTKPLMFCQSVPKSTIVYGDLEEHIVLKAVKLIEKYVLDSAQFSINISSRTRVELKKFHAMMVNNRIDDPDNHPMLKNEYLACIFDQCIWEIFILLGDSFSRFEKTKVKMHMPSILSFIQL